MRESKHVQEMIAREKQCIEKAFAFIEGAIGLKILPAFLEDDSYLMNFPFGQDMEIDAEDALRFSSIQAASTFLDNVRHLFEMARRQKL